MTTTDLNKTIGFNFYCSNSNASSAATLDVPLSCGSGNKSISGMKLCRI